MTQESPRILVVEDEPDLRLLLDRHLDGAGYRVSLAGDGIEALERAWAEPVDLVLLDLMLPHLDGIEVCRRLRQDERTARLPIIMLTAKNDTADRIRGLEVGADDYINKPFNLQELVLRVTAVLRRRDDDDDFSSRSVSIGGLRLEPHSRIVTVDDVEIDLTAREFDLLYFLINHPNRVFSRADLLRHVWDYDYAGYDRTVDAHVARLRRKLGRSGGWIETEWGIGYKFRPPSG